jgi:hypothetical protein
MKRLIPVLALAATAAMSSAQLSTLTPTNINARFGAFFVTDDNLSSATDNFLTIGFDFPLSFSLIKGNLAYLSVDIMTTNTRFDDGLIFPIMYNQRFNLSATPAGQTYLFAGAGWVTIDAVGNSKGVFGMRAGLGVDLGERLLAEGFYMYTGEVNNARANGFGVSIGYKF